MTQQSTLPSNDPRPANQDINHPDNKPAIDSFFTELDRLDREAHALQMLQADADATYDGYAPRFDAGYSEGYADAQRMMEIDHDEFNTHDAGYEQGFLDAVREAIYAELKQPQINVAGVLMSVSDAQYAIEQLIQRAAVQS